ncbi:hypothetical protein [Flavobacterium sp.]|uniref:hypothetical protein n=1 Tax=Flavobacterium sp. TaxID=239 RepID=UPI0025BD4820|nr:hypothetical protein [Flavobacterium sp.]MBA4154206.1 hypothetical protein [Flavobacterium sp.]
MKIFPTSSYTFKLFGDEKEALDRLKRRTEISQILSSQSTDKSFLGMIEGNTFKLISTEIGKGAFCVISGSIKNNEGHVKLEINKPFRILLSIILLFPIVGIGLSVILGKEDFSIILPFVAILQILMIRFFFIEIGFRTLSKHSLNKLRDVLDMDYIKKTN